MNKFESFMINIAKWSIDDNKTPQGLHAIIQFIQNASFSIGKNLLFILKILILP